MPIDSRCASIAALCASTSCFVRAVRDGHDVHVRELGAALAPVGVREDVMAPDLASGFDLAARGHAPVEQRVVPRDARPGCRRLHVLEEGREAADHAALVERSRNAQ